MIFHQKKIFAKIKIFAQKSFCQQKYLRQKYVLPENFNRKIQGVPQNCVRFVFPNFSASYVPKEKNGPIFI